MSDPKPIFDLAAAVEAASNTPQPKSTQSRGFCVRCEANECIPAPTDMCPECHGSKSQLWGHCTKCSDKLSRCCYCGAPFA